MFRVIPVKLLCRSACWCAHRKRNCLFKLETSIVSMSMTSMLPKPVKAKSLSSSQPSPPAPTQSTRQLSRRNSLTAGSGSKSGPVILPDRFSRKSKSFHRPDISICVANGRCFMIESPCRRCTACQACRHTSKCNTRMRSRCVPHVFACTLAYPNCILRRPSVNAVGTLLSYELRCKSL